MFFSRLFTIAVVALSSSPGMAEDWLRFRGNNGSGVSASAVPTTWGPRENLKWKVTLPGPGVSSPIVVGDKVFITCYSGYGVARDAGDIDQLKRHLLCFDKSTGSELWSKAIAAAQPEDPYSGVGIPAHGYASHTPASDGERVFAFFGKSGVHAFDLDGTALWVADVGTKSDPWGWGSSSSPVVYKDKLFVTASAESESLIALDTRTGREIWRESAGGFAGMWGTPTLVEANESGRAELVLSVPYEVWSFDPESGKLLWYCETGDAQQAHASAIAGQNVVYAFGNRGGSATAVRAGGTDNVSDSQVVWKMNQTAGFASPIAFEGKIYLVVNDVLTTFDAATGEEQGPKLRLRAGGQATAAADANDDEGGTGRRGGGGGFGNSDYASPVIADGKLIYLKRNGETVVVQLKPELKQLAVNKVSDEDESFGGTPAVSDGQLFIRSSKHLYCIGE